MRAAALIVSTLVAATAAADRDDRVIEGRVEAGAATRIALEAGVGEVRLEAGADDSITWRVALEADPGRSSVFKRKRRIDEVRAGLEEASVKDVARGDRVTLSLELPASLDDDDLKQRWLIAVPRRFAADLELGVGEMTIRGVAGGVEASVDVGELEIEVPGGAIDASVDIGDLSLVTEGAGTGDISLEADVGDVDLELGGRRIRTDGGYGPGESIRLDGKDGPRIRLSVDIGDIEARIGR